MKLCLAIYISLIWVFYRLSELRALTNIGDKNVAILKVTNMSTNIYWKKFKLCHGTDFKTVEVRALKALFWKSRYTKEQYFNGKNFNVDSINTYHPRSYTTFNCQFSYFFNWSEFIILHLDEALFIDKYGFSLRLEKKYLDKRVFSIKD